MDLKLLCYLSDLFICQQKQQEEELGCPRTLIRFRRIQYLRRPNLESFNSFLNKLLLEFCLNNFRRYLRFQLCYFIILIK